MNVWRKMVLPKICYNKWFSPLVLCMTKNISNKNTHLIIVIININNKQFGTFPLDQPTQKASHHHLHHQHNLWLEQR